MPDTREQETDTRTGSRRPPNRHQIIPWIKYYLFLKKDHPTR